jgi:hypothetical protein
VTRRWLLALVLTLSVVALAQERTGRTSPDVPLIIYVDRLFHEKDVRDQQRFEAQTVAVKAALDAQEKAVAAALAAAAQAVDKAESAATKRFESLNELRGMTNDLASRLMTKSEADLRLRSLESRMDRLEAERGGLHRGWLLLLGALGGVGTLIGVYSFVTKKAKP